MRVPAEPERRRVRGGTPEDAFRIALICTGNRFRSPLAEAFLRRDSGDLPVSLHSYGTRRIGPMPPLPEALEAAARYGLELDHHRARPLDGVRLSGADLVLGFERAHVATGVVDAGAGRQRTFLLQEIVGLLASLPPVEGQPSPELARERVARAHKLRAWKAEASPRAELRDPLGGPPAGYVESASRLADLCQDLLRGLFGLTRLPPLEQLAAPPRSERAVRPR
jgi:protein-tyrosine phosphatase